MIDHELRDKLDVVFRDVKIDKKLIENIRNFRLAWAQKNEGHIEFLGGGTIGVQKVIMSSKDEDMLFNTILQVEPKDIKNVIDSVDKINKNFKTISNYYYISMIYLVHKFYMSNLSAELIQDGIKELYYTFAYKIISSIITAYFKYQVNPVVAKTVFEKLSAKYLVKKLGSWNAFFDYRTKDWLPKGLHHNRLIAFDTEDVLYTISDGQVRIKECIKAMYKILNEVNKSSDVITETSLLGSTPEGEIEFKEMGKGYAVYSNNIKTILFSSTDLIYTDLVELVLTKYPDITRRPLYQTLNAISEFEQHDMEKIIDVILEYAFTELGKKQIYNYRKNIYQIIIVIKGLFNTNSNKNQRLKAAKKTLEAGIKKLHRSYSRNFMKPLVSALMVYLTVRSFYIHKQ